MVLMVFATSVTIIVLTFFTIVAFKTGQKDVAIFSIALCGALLGFLKYNAFPAKILWEIQDPWH